MKKFIILTTSESSDHYHYFIKSEEKPTKEQLEKFLQENANDKDDDEVYENVDEVIEIKKKKFITL